MLDDVDLFPECAADWGSSAMTRAKRAAAEKSAFISCRIPGRRNFAGSSSRRRHRGCPSPAALQDFLGEDPLQGQGSRRPQIDGRLVRSARARDFDALDLLRLACLHFPLPAPCAYCGFGLRLYLAPEGREFGSAERAPCAIVGGAFGLKGRLSSDRRSPRTSPLPESRSKRRAQQRRRFARRRAFAPYCDVAFLCIFLVVARRA